jgi:hypothetical protein
LHFYAGYASVSWLIKRNSPAYSIVWVPSLNLCEGVKTFGDIAV